jgi:hypothetical protein
MFGLTALEVLPKLLSALKYVVAPLVILFVLWYGLHSYVDLKIQKENLERSLKVMGDQELLNEKISAENGRYKTELALRDTAYQALKKSVEESVDGNVDVPGDVGDVYRFIGLQCTDPTTPTTSPKTKP